MKKRQERAQKIAEKEEYTEKRHRLLNVLVQKLLLKFGLKTEQGLPKSQISDIVSSYLDKVPSIVNVTSLRNVKDLELDLSKELRNMKPPKTTKTTLPNKLSNASKEDVCIQRVTSCGECSVKHKNTRQLSPITSQLQGDLDTDKVNPWALIETFQIVENESSIEEKKVKAAQKKRDMANVLQGQIRTKKDTAKEEKTEDDKFLVIQRNAIKDWEEEKVLKAIVEQDKIAELKKVRQEQVEGADRKRKEEQAEKMSSELREIENIKLALEKEEQMKHQQKQLEREKWERITIENLRKNEKRQLQKDEEARMDAKLMEEMKKKYEEEARKRAKAVEDRKVKSEMNGQLLSEAGAFNKREEMIKFEKNFLKEAEAREQVQATREKKKRDMERKKKQLITESNKQMAEEKRRRDKEIEKENEAYAWKCLKEKEELLREEEAGRMKQHETKEKYRKALDDQVEEQKKQQNFDGMTAVERSVNKKLMKKLENSKVKKKLLDKMTSCNNTIHNNDEIDVS